jgi:hypothetical protein
MKARGFQRALCFSITALLLGAAPLGSGAEARDTGSETPARTEQEQNIAEQWGIEIESLRLTAASYMLDFRYTVIDAEKARPLFERSTKPVLIDQASEAQFVVPSPAKVGPLRNSNQPIPGRTYFMFFANPGKFIKPGNRVTVEIGEFRAEDLVVE